MLRPTLALALSLSFTAHAGSYYNGDDPNPAPLKYPDNVLTPTLKQQLERVKVTTLKGPNGVTELGKLSRVEKIAVLYASGTSAGAQFDAMIEDGGQYVPVKTWWDGDTITFETGAPRKQLYGKASSKEEIQQKYGVGPFVDSGATWDNDALFVVETALAALSKAELQGVAGLPFHRMKKDPSNKSVRGAAIAMYVPEKSQIELYDYGIEADQRKFFGTIQSPVPLSVGAVLHECGHALSRRTTRDVRQQAVDAKREYDEVNAKIIEGKKTYDVDKATFAKTRDPELAKSLNERAVGLKALVAELAVKRAKFEPLAAQMTQTESKGSTVELLLDKKLPFKTAPTLYGRTSLTESFAECFMLNKLDRAGLERAAPGVPAWFESAEYLALIAPPAPK